MTPKTLPQFDQIPPGRVLLRMPAVRRKTGLSRSTLYQLMASPTAPFPPPIKLGSRISAWDAAAIDAWIAAREAASRQTVEP